MEIQVLQAPELNPPSHKSDRPPATSKIALISRKRVPYMSGKEDLPQSLDNSFNVPSSKLALSVID